MTALVDARPPGLDAFFRPGDPFVVTLLWPTGELAGRTYTATLDAAPLTVDIATDTMTVTVTPAQTTAAAADATFTLTDTTDADPVDVISGRWSPSLRAGTSSSAEVTVNAGTGSVTVELTGIGAATVAALGGRVTATEDAIAADPFTASGDIVIPGVIQTGTFGSPPTFGGIEREAVCFPCSGMSSPTAVVNFGDGWPRLNCPDGVTTNIYQIIQIQEWWLASTIGVYFEWVNDHSATGNVRFDLEMREVDIATEALADADVICAVQRTASVAPNTMMTTHVGSIATGNPIFMNPGTFAATYVLRITRLGLDPLDTLAGPIGIVAASMTRGQ